MHRVTLSWSFFVALSLLLVSCDRPFADPAAPDVNFLEPDFSSVQIRDDIEIVISASAFRPISSATVNGEDMIEDEGAGNWAIDWNLQTGVNQLDISVTDVDGNVTDTTEYAVWMDYLTTPRLNAMKVATGGHATTITLNGALLVTGGTAVAGGQATNRVEILTAGATVFQTSQSSMVHARSGHTATLLPDGRILVAGGSDKDDITAIGDLVQEPEIFNPDDQVFEPMAVVGDPIRRSFHTASVRVVNGSIIVDLYGGVGDVQYTPESQLGLRSDIRSFQVRNDTLIALSPAVGPNLPNAISGHTQTRLDPFAFNASEYLVTGSTFVGGGHADIGFTVDFASQAGIVTDDTALLATPRTRHSSARLGKDLVLIWGGRQESRNSGLSDAELFVRPANRFISLPLDSGSTPIKRYGHTTSVLFPGLMIIVGGYSNSGVAIPHAEIFDYDQ